MDFRISAGSGFFALALAWRAIAIGALAFLVVYLVATTQLYATALVVACIAALITNDLARVARRADRTLERFLEGLSAGASETPARALTGFGGLNAAIDKTARSLRAARDARSRDVEYLQALLDTVGAALLVVAPDGQITLANRAAHVLAGPVGRLSDITALGAPAAQMLAGLAPGARQIMRLADGRQVFASAARFSVPGAGPQRLISLQRVAGELDAIELKAWQDVARVLAHEMMNSLTPIASLSESLDALVHAPAQAAISDEVKGAIEAIKRRSFGLMDFVERYRQIAELPQPVLRRVDAEAFFIAIDRLMRAGFAAKGISYRRHLSLPNFAITADPQLLEQAMINLLRNAMDAVAETDAPSIETACHVADGQLVLTVSDNGRGLPERNPDDVFVPFFTTKPDGSGIGLSLVRQIALAHGGRVTAEANMPRGTIFKMVLPV